MGPWARKLPSLFTGDTEKTPERQEEKGKERSALNKANIACLGESGKDDCSVKAVALQARKGFLLHPETQRKSEKNIETVGFNIQDQEWCEGSKEAV